MAYKSKHKLKSISKTDLGHKTKLKSKILLQRYLNTILRFFLLMPIAALAFIGVLIISYTYTNPGLSTFMAGELLRNGSINHKWVPMNKISKHIPIAVIASEDNRFCEHAGVDWKALEKVIAQRKRSRGASTIPMQTVKNLFLWPGRSYIRKAIEIPLAYTVSIFWSKRRLMEIYLNIVELGPGIFGVEAASRYHFKKPASKISPREATLLAAILPNPIGRNAGRPGPKTRLVSRLISERMLSGRRYASCIFQKS